MDKGMTMSQREISRIEVMERLKRGEIKHKESCRLLGISIRQSKRLKKRYTKSGDQGLVHLARGQANNHRIAGEEVEVVMNMVKKEYSDSGPTLAHEKLSKKGLIFFSVERLRQEMINHDLWKPKKRRKARNHPCRERRDCLGELVQIDGSPHKWFENRSPACTLIALYSV